MAKEEENIMKLAEGFFKNLKCKINWDGKVLVINNVPEDFEKDFGKKGPYFLVFNREDYDKHENSELVARGSVLLKIIANYLEERGQTTLLRLNFNPNLKDLVLKEIDLNGYVLKGIDDKINYDYIIRFIFLTNFQYLNEREQITSSIYIKDKKILDKFDVEDFDSVEGKKEEINIKDINEEYIISKKKLKENINEKTKEIVDKLNFSLESAMNRIKSHYLHQMDEFNSEIKRNEENILSLKERIRKGIEKDVVGAEEKIKRLKSNIEKIKNSDDMNRVEKERDVYINDEKSKHSLNVNNKLINTSIIYYPIYNIDVSLLNKNKHVKHINLVFNPVKKELSSLNCENCGEKLAKVNICHSNHIYCEGCGNRCVCGTETCEKCEKLSCNICGRGVCIKCGARCSICNKYACSSDMCLDNLTGRHICNHCAKYCSICNKFSNKANFFRCGICGKEMCSRCSKIDFKLKKKVCVDCFKPTDFRV
ncbi:hypothetical protein J4218_03015 [Candidatus Pacearchaeota archaeon]|nr:hypothetical protein [Candidatus Pacearchaeota archaeon]